MKLCRHAYEVDLGPNMGNLFHCHRRAGHEGPHAKVRISRVPGQPDVITLVDCGKIPPPKEKRQCVPYLPS